MVVDHAGGLHEGIDDGGAGEAEAPCLQLLRDAFGERRLRRHLSQCAEAVLERAAAVTQVEAIPAALAARMVLAAALEVLVKAVMAETFLLRAAVECRGR